MEKLFLICNAHLDPVWLWEWEEGAAETISTFRTAADLCEEFEGFVFNHNEVILYQWVEEYEPKLFNRIKKLVSEGKWHIMGGWYLQPDCNMISGESFVRQALLGREYFKEKFGVVPKTAVNFDSFGHSRGLVQILKKSGYNSYVFCRPDKSVFTLPSDDFIWGGYDGSEIVCHRASEHYNSSRGEARAKVEKWMEENNGNDVCLIHWGIGNHGGGPSRTDLKNLQELINDRKDCSIIHSTPESYFKEMADKTEKLPRVEIDLNPWAVGCYTSQVRIKQKHRQLENEAFMVEKMLSSASIQGYLDYPEDSIHEVFCDLAMSEFHDILPGSSIQPVEEGALRLMDHGLEKLSRLKARAFFALAEGQKRANEGEIPILVYNPHPYKVFTIIECEFQLPDQNWKDEFSMPVVYQENARIPSQTEKELSNLSLDWRKHVVFAAELEPSQMNRFDCRIEVLLEKPGPQLKETNGLLLFKSKDMEVVINCKTGLIDSYKVRGFEYLKVNSFLPVVIEDDDDSWGMYVKSFRNLAGQFELMSKEEGTKVSGVTEGLLESVRVIEDGSVRSVIEAVFTYGDSFICQTYKIPKQGTEFQVQVRVQWNEKRKMLKLSVPTKFVDAGYLGQTAYGIVELKNNGEEVVAQKWMAVLSDSVDRAFTCINDGVYGSDFKDGEMRISLIRSPGYSAHPILNRPIMPQDRYSLHIDQGERVFNFWLSGGTVEERLENINREALTHNEKPYALSFFPAGTGIMPNTLVSLDDASIQMSAFKKAEKSKDYILRLFEPTGKARKSTVSLPFTGMQKKLTFSGFEIKTLRLDMGTKTIEETDLMENSF